MQQTDGAYSYVVAIDEE